MAIKLGTENLKKGVSLMLSYGNQVDVALADGKLNLGDAYGFFDELMSTGEVYEKRKEIAAEGLDVDDVERKELHDMAINEFNIRNDEVEVKVEAAIGLLLAVLVFLSAFKKKDTGTPPAPKPGK